MSPRSILEIREPGSGEKVIGSHSAISALLPAIGRLRPRRALAQRRGPDGNTRLYCTFMFERQSAAAHTPTFGAAASLVTTDQAR
jgi:hypothetical protein